MLNINVLTQKMKVSGELRCRDQVPCASWRILLFFVPGLHILYTLFFVIHLSKMQSSHNISNVGLIMILTVSKRWTFFHFSSTAKKKIALLKISGRGNMIGMVYWEFLIICSWIMYLCEARATCPMMDSHRRQNTVV